MKNYFFKIIVASLSLSLLVTVSLYAQVERTVIVKDQSGNPISGAKVTIGETINPVATNDKGEFSLKLQGRTPVLIEAEGYDPKLIDPAETPGDVTLIKKPYQMTDKDQLPVPFDLMTRRQIPGAYAVLDPADILKYNQESGYSGILSGRVSGLFGSDNIRQLGSALIIVDGIARPATDLNIQEIDKIVVLKDLASTLMYGTQARNGVILITTKRGHPLKKYINVSASSGMNRPISYPKYLAGAEYMTLYNEALSNDGLQARYTPGQIDSTAMGSDPVRYPDESYYNSTYLKDFSTFYNITGEVSGGNDIAQYYLNLGWKRDNSILKLGEGGNEKTDRLKVRGNVNYKLTDFIKITFDGAANFNITSSPRYTTTASDFWQLSSTLRPNNTPVLIPVELMEDQTLLGAAQLIDGKYLLGGTSQYMTNIYGELTRNGPRETNERLVQMNTGLDFDLKSITPGLSASAYISFDMYSSFYADLMNTYAVYRPNYGVDTIIWDKYGTDSKVDQRTLTDMTFYRRMGVYGKVDYRKMIGTDHALNINAVAYRDQYTLENIWQDSKHLQFGVRANYMFKNKYIVELTGIESGSVKLFETKAWAFSPAASFGWVLSEESFLSGNTLINYLKAHANIALLNTDESLTNYWLARSYYNASSTFYYNQGSTSNASRNIINGNSKVGYEKRLNFNIGLESMLADNKIGLDASYFYYRTYDVITRRANMLPIYYGSLPYENYGQYQTQGAELGINYNTKIGDLGIRVEANFVYAVPKSITVDELNYEESYRKLSNKPTDAMFGYVALGLFADQAEIDASPFQTFGTVKPGDIKYQDLNNDKVIDDRDQKMIGNSDARAQTGININLNYKNFDLFVLGTGQLGDNNLYNSAYYWVYADRKYSEVVRDRWTPATASTATYPRLTSLSNSNNFRNSTYWLYDNNWFNLGTAQLTYSFPDNFVGLKNLRLYVRGDNMLMISKIKDKTQLNVGTVPQMRSISFGLNVML